MGKDKTVVVSDLHIDTWNDKKFYGKTKLQHFFDFLQWIEPVTATFVINGDLFDAPPPKNTDILPTYETVISGLIELAATTEVYYFIGNHDIGLWGLRVGDYRNLHVVYPYYPHLHIKAVSQNNHYLYFEHGHFYDPVLSLYVHQMVQGVYPKVSLARIKKFLYRLLGRRQAHAKLVVEQAIDAGTLNHAALRASQRRDPRTGEKTHPLGTRAWQDYWQNLQTSVWKVLAPLVTEYYTPLNWQNAAQAVFERFCREYPDMEIKAVIFGHTHLPDEQELLFGDRQAVYLNSGDWSEPVLDKDPDTHHSSFIIFDAEGRPERDAGRNAVRDYISEQQGPQATPPEPASRETRPAAT